MAQRIRLIGRIAVFLAVGFLAPQMTNAAGQGFSLHAKPVMERGSQGAWSASFIDPGAMTIHDGKFHMMFDALPKWPHPLAIGYASSEDGINWVKESDGPVLTAEDTGLDVKSIMANSMLVTDEGQWVLYFTLVDPEKHFVGKIARATAPSPLGPWTTDPEPVLEPGPEGAWDGKYVGNASVVQSDEGYRMYYTGTGKYEVGAFTEEHDNIGMATSPDGITWTKHDGPVFQISDVENAWDSWSLTETSVQKTNDGWAMVYRGTSFNTTGQLGLAMSDDGITWRRAGDGPIIATPDIHKKIYFVTYLRDGDQDFIYFEAGSTAGTDIYLATRQHIF
ncbi:MAG: hypothetical protein AAF495_24025 [Pseudomonadota bacterium]